MIKIENENCLDTIQRIYGGGYDFNKVDVVLTSPPYNTARVNNKTKIGSYDYKSGESFPDDRYDSYNDNMTNEEYCQFTVNLFNEFNKILSKNGVILYNISYGSENTECMFMAVNDVIRNTPFTIADTIVWKKKVAVPNNVSPNKLTRICEFVFVFCREDELDTFNSNKKCISTSTTGQAIYENVYNLIEADNNDGVCPYNRATYSSSLCMQLLNIYAKKGSMVYDPFMGSGTTAVACKKMGYDCIGSELSEKQVQYALNRIDGADSRKRLW